MEIYCGYMLLMETLRWPKLTGCNDAVSDNAGCAGEDFEMTAELELSRIPMLNPTFAALK